MSTTLDNVKAHLNGLLKGGNVDDLTEPALMFERVQNTVLSKIDPTETIRTQALSSTIHDDVFNYSLPSDYKKLIDIIPQDGRDEWDKAYRTGAGEFDLKKAIANKVISIEGSEGSKIIRINWRSRSPKTIHNMNSVTANGTWGAVATAANIEANSIFKVSGGSSIEFDIVTTGDGIENTTMDSVDLTDEDEVADFFVWMYFNTAPTSITMTWGNDLTTNYWTSTAQTTQADGTNFKVGWNLIKFPWSTATESGTVTPSTIDAVKITVASSAQNNVRIDNITCSIGRNFDIKYYSKYLIKNSSGTLLERTTNDSDILILDNDALNIFLFESLIAAAQQSQNDFGDLTWAKQELNGDANSTDPEQRRGLYGKYRAEYPSQGQKLISHYNGLPKFRK